MDPRIGILNSGVHYAFVDGYDKPEFRGTLAEVERALGIEIKTAQVTRRRSLKRYEVTVTPAVVGYTSTGYGGGSERHGSYTVEIDAETARKAEQEARKAYRDEEGRMAPGVTCKARRVD